MVDTTRSVLKTSKFISTPVQKCTSVPGCTGTGTVLVHVLWYTVHPVLRYLRTADWTVSEKSILNAGTIQYLLVNRLDSVRLSVQRGWRLSACHSLPFCYQIAHNCLVCIVLAALYSVVCAHCSTCGLSQQVHTLPELSTLRHTLCYLVIHHARDPKRRQLNRQPQQVCRLRCV